jgi:transposase
MRKSILGIDVSKNDLVVSLLDHNSNKRKTSTFSNNAQGHKELDQWVRSEVGNHKVLAVSEATGSYSEKIADYLYFHKYDVSIVNPFRIKAYANSKLSRHKTDMVDASLIAEFANVNDVKLYKPRSKELKELNSLYRCLQSLKKLKTEAGNHLECKDCLPKSVIKIWEKIVNNLEKKISEVEKKAFLLLAKDDNIQRDYNNLQTIPGISKTTAIAILSELPEISNFNNARQLAAYIGITPKHKISGSSIRGKPRISKIGSSILRKALYFPSIVAKKHNPVIKAFCKPLKEKGKHAKVIICAAMRKLVHIVFAVLKHNHPFNAEIHGASAQSH